MISKKNKMIIFIASCWLLLALILLIIFLVKKDTYISTLKQTDFLEKVFGKTPEFIQNYEPKEKNVESNGLLDVRPTPGPGEIDDSDDTNPEYVDSRDDGAAYYTSPDYTDIPESDADGNLMEGQPGSVEDRPFVAENPEDAYEPAAPVEIPVETPPAPVVMTNAKLCFVSITGDGSVSRKVVTRSVPKTDAPLTNAIKELLEGPLNSEKGCMTLIPEGTRLLGASVKNGIAALNFSEEFEYNSVGTDGYRAQLMQIVFTATEFSTVESVQILIEGRRNDYVGSGEDIWMWIGSPYSRSSVN